MQKYLLIIQVVSYCICSNFIFAQDDSKKWTLSDCLQHAIQNNLTVQDAELTKRSSEVSYTLARYQRFPSINASVNQRLTNGTSIDPITSDYVSQAIHSTSGGINASMTLFNANYINNTIKQNKLSVEQNDLYLQEAKNNIILSVTEAFLRLLYLKEGIAVAENTLSSSKIQLEQIKRKYEAGAAAGLDVANLETQVSNDEYSLIVAANNYRQQLIALKQLLELEPTTGFDIESAEIEETIFLVPQLSAVYESALEKMPEIERAQKEIEISEYDLAKAKAGYWPSLSLSAGLNTGYTNTQADNFGEQLRRNFNQSAGLTLNIPIFSRYQNTASVKIAEIGIKRAELNTANEKKQLYLKIENAWQNATSNQSEMIAAETLKKSSELAYQIAQEKATAGSLSMTDLLISKNTYVSANQKYLQAKYSGLLYYQLLQFYLGNEITL